MAYTTETFIEKAKYDNYEMASAFKLMNNILKNNSFSREKSL